MTSWAPGIKGHFIHLILQRSDNFFSWKNVLKLHRSNYLLDLYILTANDNFLVDFVKNMFLVESV